MTGDVMSDDVRRQDGEPKAASVSDESTSEAGDVCSDDAILTRAVAAGDWKVVQTLLSQKGEMMLDSRQLLTVLCGSTTADDSSLLKCLNLILEYGADPGAADWMGATPLAAAVKNNREILAVRLINAGCPVNQPDFEGWTPLFYAVHNGNVSIAQTLIDCGAKTNLMDRSGRTVNNIAATTKNKDLIKMTKTSEPLEFALDVPKNTRKIQRRTFKTILNDGPKFNDRLYGFHDEAIQFLRGINLEFVASVMSTKNLQFAQLLTWSDDEWDDADVKLSYHKNKIRSCVRQFHEKEWSSGAVPNVAHICDNGRVDLFKVVQCLASFLRTAHIASASSLYLLKNSSSEHLSDEADERLRSIRTALVVVKKHTQAIEATCRRLEDTGAAQSPDLIDGSDSKPSKTPRYFVVVAGVAAFILTCNFLYKRRLF